MRILPSNSALQRCDGLRPSLNNLKPVKMGWTEQTKKSKTYHRYVHHLSCPSIYMINTRINSSGFFFYVINKRCFKRVQLLYRTARPRASFKLLLARVTRGSSIRLHGHYLSSSAALPLQYTWTPCTILQSCIMAT